METVMLVKIYDRTPGGKTLIGKTKMDAIPRQGETCFVDDEAKIVHEVTWDLTKMEVHILLRT